jgi:UDP-glucuronate decarboxylase
VVSNFIVQALRGNSITIYGDGSQTRSFCFVDDLIEGLLNLLKAESNSIYQPINLGNPTTFTMLELAEMVLRLTNSESKIDFQDLPGDDPRQRKPDISLAKELLSWEPKVGLEDGLKKTISYFDSIL